MSVVGVIRAWLIIVPAMIANGIFRELVIRRFVGPDAAEIISAALGIAIIGVMTRYLLRALAGRPTAELAKASITLVLLTVAFEFLFGHYVDRKSWTALVENYAIWDGELWPLVLAALALMPFVWGRWSLSEPSHAG